MQLSLYNGAYCAEGEPSELAMFLAFHIDSMQRIVDKRQEQEAANAVDDLLMKIFKKPKDDQEDK